MHIADNTIEELGAERCINNRFAYKIQGSQDGCHPTTLTNEEVLLSSENQTCSNKIMEETQIHVCIDE